MSRERIEAGVGVDLDQQLWLVTKLMEVNAELYTVQANRADAFIVGRAKQRIMQECEIDESKAYKLIGKLAMHKRTTKKIIAEEVLGSTNIKRLFKDVN